MPSVDRADLHGAETVLPVDDEPSIRRAGSRMLVRFGYRVVTAERGRDARDLIDIIGLHWPDLPVLLSTGYDAGRLGQGELAPCTGLVPKPCTLEEMLRAVRSGLDGR